MQRQGLRAEALGVCGAPAPNRLTTSFRLGGGVLIDAGGAAHAIPVREWQEIQHLLLSHSHLDHTLGIPFLLTESSPVVYGLQETLDAVRESLLDGRIWPDLSKRARWREITEGQTLSLGGLEIEVGPANHTVPCLSFLVREHGKSLAVIGDTRLDDATIAWAADRNPDACVVECSYPRALQAIADQFGHQTTADLGPWRQALGADCGLYLTHVKPKHETAIRAECVALGEPRLHVLRDGDVIET